MTDARDTERLYQLIASQRELLMELRQFAAIQYEIVQRNELGKLVSLLARKQDAINRLTAVDKQLEEFRDQDPESRVWVSEERRDACRKLAKECPQLLSDVMKLEQAAEARLSEQRDEVAQRIQQTSARSQAASAYLKNAVEGPIASSWSVEQSD